MPKPRTSRVRDTQERKCHMTQPVKATVAPGGRHSDWVITDVEEAKRKWEADI